MSDEQQQPEQVQVAQAEQPKDKWDELISKDRQRELLGMREAWDAPDADHGKRMGPFDGVTLSGRDVLWLGRVRQILYAEQLCNDMHLPMPNGNDCLLCFRRR